LTRHFASFSCEGATLWGTLDAADGASGLLIVSGGNEIRSGPWASQALLAARIAAAGYPVFRFDRRGIGDSDGPAGGFRTSAPDIAAAIAAFRAQVPSLKRVVAYGNCDGASALMLAGDTDCDAMVLSNPWTVEEGIGDDAQPMLPEVVRAHYWRRLKDPGALLRLIVGQVSLRQLIASLRDAARPAAPPSTLASELAAGLADFSGAVTILLAGRDRTAQAFLARWDKSDKRLRTCADATHSFVEQDARIWLLERLVDALRN
jgi:exosortase A-associated hydrolase 1